MSAFSSMPRSAGTLPAYARFAFMSAVPIATASPGAPYRSSVVKLPTMSSVYFMKSVSP